MTVIWKRTLTEINRPSQLVHQSVIKKNTGTCTPHTGDWSCCRPCGCGSAGETDAGVETAGAATEFVVESATVYNGSSGCRLGPRLFISWALHTKGCTY
ncbi:hypothetical protein M378DRAFT_422787 [Amanita muscaria Koide BX008]|uniref:Uncharacterized protein n=1 Tax=Amanita muscaria (strain Koide BX008) TaxID=946122 RepID=A0A0C2WLG1_AMAMK|nr:hypothetical protein M378DRAFT_422787 [Amanita muscaria Koide BX008]